MRLLFTLTFLACFSFQSKTQVTYHNYFDHTTEWNDVMESWYYDFACNDFAVEYSFLRYYFNGDTLINGNWYYKMYVHRHDSIVCPSGTTIQDMTTFQRPIREDASKKVYSNFNGVESTMWDFNIAIGMTPIQDCTIDSISTVSFYGGTRDVYHCDCFEGSYIIEGIGADGGFVDPTACAIGIETNRKMVCHMRGNDILQVDTTWQCGLTVGISETKTVHNYGFQVFPNPMLEEAQFMMDEAPNQALDFQLYAMDGKLIHQETVPDLRNFKLQRHNWPSGIYFYQLKSEKALFGSGKLVVE